MKLEQHARVKNGDIQAVRRKALQRVITDDYDGNVSAFGRSANKSQSQLADMLAGRKAFGERVARAIEAETGLIPGILDRDPDDPNSPAHTMIFGAPITAEAAQIGREWAKLAEPLRGQIAELIVTLVAMQARENKKQKRRSA